MRTTSPHRSRGLLLAVLLVGLIATSCRTSGAPTQTGETNIDSLVRGVPDPEMKQRWLQADADGKLPPLNTLQAPAPGQAVTTHRPGKIAAAPPPNYRPVFPEGADPSAEVWSSRPVREYTGSFRLQSAEPGLLIGRIGDKEQEAALEIHFKLPEPTQKLRVEQGMDLTLRYREGVVDNALQRQVVVLDGRGGVPLLYLAEGSSEPYRAEIKSLGITIAQQRLEAGVPTAVTVTRGQAEIVTLRPGEQQILGKERNPLRVLLLESMARSPQRAMVTEGQPYYVRIMIYNAR